MSTYLDPKPLVGGLEFPRVNGKYQIGLVHLANPIKRLYARLPTSMCGHAQFSLGNVDWVCQRYNPVTLFRCPDTYQDKLTSIVPIGSR